MHTGNSPKVKILYGIRHKQDRWMMTEDKAARDNLWENITRYSYVASEWEICERIVISSSPQPMSVEAVEQNPNSDSDIVLDDPVAA